MVGKLTRWKGGLKSGNRREVDITEGSFNKEFLIKNEGPEVGRANWKVVVEDQSHALNTERLEQPGYASKLLCKDDFINSDNFVSEVLGGGVIYEANDVRRVLIQSGVNNPGSTILSNTASGLDILKDGKQALRLVEPIISETWIELQAIDDIIYQTQEWNLSYEVPEALVYYGVKFYFLEAGIPIRLTFSTLQGYEWFTSVSEYDWERGQTGDLRSEAYPEASEFMFADPFFLDVGTMLNVRIQSTLPISLVGTNAKGEQGEDVVGPHNGKSFLAKTDVRTAEVDITPIDFKTLGHGVFPTAIITLEADTIVTAETDSLSTDEIITAITTDSLNLCVTVEWDRSRAWNEIPFINGRDVAVTSYEDGTYIGSVDVPLAFEESQLIITKGTFRSIIPVTRPAIPQVLTSSLDQVYPGSQTELKAGDLFTLNITSDIPFTRLVLTAGLSTQNEVTFVATTSLAIELTVTNQDRDFALLTQSFKIGNPYLSTEYTTVDTLNHSDLRPSIEITSITYPIGQQALKDSEQATVNHIIQDYTTVSYEAIGSEVSVVNPTVVEPKVFTRIGGGYNVLIPNFKITATRAANGAITIVSSTVAIADLAPLIYISAGGTALRSGGNDGTVAPDNLVTMFSDQRLLLAPTCLASIGSLQGLGFSWSPQATTFTRYLRIHDDDVKGLGVFTALVAYGLAGRVTTTFIGLANYISAGFVSRDIIIPPTGWTFDISTLVYNVVNLRVYWSFTAQYLAYVDSPVSPNPGHYYINLTNSNVKLLDKDATDASTQNTIITIEEVV